LFMSKKKIISLDSNETFGKRMARIRKAAGYSQRDLAKDIGISQRMVAYYESQSDFPPGALLPLIAKALSVSSDLLLGLKNEIGDKLYDARLLTRFRKVNSMSKSERRLVIQLIDRIIELESFKNQSDDELSHDDN